MTIGVMRNSDRWYLTKESRLQTLTINHRRDGS